MQVGPQSPAIDPDAEVGPPEAISPTNDVAAGVVAICVAVGLAMVLAGAIGIAGQTRDLQFIAYVLGFGVLLPVAVGVVLRLRSAPRDHGALQSAALASAAIAAASLCALRVAGLVGVPADLVSILSVLGGLISATLALILSRFFTAQGGGRRPGAAAGWTLSRPTRVALAGGLLSVLIVLLFIPEEVTPFRAITALAAGLAAAASPRFHAPPIASRRLAYSLDALLLVAIVLLTVDVTGYWRPGLTAPSWAQFSPPRLGPIAGIHQNFYLGPVNDVLHGRALLVDANAVYGIGNTYLIAGWFKVLPFGYGMFGLLGGLASAMVIAVGWGILRAAAVTRLIAATTVAVGLLLTVLAPVTSPALFLNVGGLRFAPPYLLLAVAMAAGGRPGAVSRSPWVLGTFAFFSLWSVEAVVYCTCTYAALVAVEALSATRLRAAAKGAAGSAALVVAACVLAHLAFAVLTRLLGGGWPDWGSYISLFRAWSEILADVFGGAAEPWSRAWLIGGLYLASAVGTVLLVRRSTAADTTACRLAIAIAGTTGLGISVLSYFIAHSRDLFLPFIAYPVLLALALWLSLALRSDGGAPPAWQRASLGLACLAAALLVLGSWTPAGNRLPRTALAHLVPGGPSLSDDLGLMWDSPPIDPRSISAEELIDRYFPPDLALVLIEPDLGQEALFRSGRSELLPISYPWQDEVDLEHSLPPVLDAVAGLQPGTRMLLQGRPPPGVRPSFALAFEQAFGNVPLGQRLGPLASAALQAIRSRFSFREIAGGPDRLRVVELVPR